MSATERFWGKVSKSEGCWVWTGPLTKKGRAYFKVGGRSVIAARWIWAELNGPIMEGLCVLHECDNPSCVNPNHLFLGTQIQNIADRDAKGRNRLSAKECKNGHDLTGDGVRKYGPEGRWRFCRECGRQAMVRYRSKKITEAEARAY